jgi:hypothetical protein
MNGKNLIISFVTVSILSLLVSTAAVFTAARSYSRMLSENHAKKETSGHELSENTSTVTDSIWSAPEDSLSSIPEKIPVTEGNGDTEDESASVTEIPEITTDNEIPSFTLFLSGERLKVTDNVGNILYERITDLSDIKENDLVLLRKGIEFPDVDSAISAIYDLIS